MGNISKAAEQVTGVLSICPFTNKTLSSASEIGRITTLKSSTSL